MLDPYRWRAYPDSPSDRGTYEGGCHPSHYRSDGNCGTRRQFPESSEGNTGVRAVQGNHQDHDGIRHGLSEESPCEGWLFQSGHYAGSGWD